MANQSKIDNISATVLSVKSGLKRGLKKSKSAWKMKDILQNNTRNETSSFLSVQEGRGGATW